MRSMLRLLAMAAVCLLSLQLFFIARIALMAICDPASTAFQRSSIVAHLREDAPWRWQQGWSDAIAPSLYRAVIASEDATFVEHSGVEWDALEKAWERNQQAAQRAEKAQAQQAARRSKAEGRAALNVAPRPVQPKVVGGSTIPQQLVKNVFLSGERTMLRKAQELLLALVMDALLSKERTLTIYLNSVEWGRGLYGAQAAAQRYFRVDAARLSTGQAARLAVMLPAPKRFEARFGSPYQLSRAATIEARMGDVAWPPK